MPSWRQLDAGHGIVPNTRVSVSSVSTYLQMMMQKEPMMNKYALLAQRFWQTHASQRYASLENPQEYFEDLGESAAAQIEAISLQQEAKMPQDLDYLAHLRQLVGIRKQAEEIVLSDLVYSIETEPRDLIEELEEILGDLPDPRMIQATLRQIQDEAEQESEQEGLDRVVLSEDQVARKEQLTALLPLVSVDPDMMDEPELRDQILTLQPFWDPQNRSLKRLP